MSSPASVNLVPLAVHELANRHFHVPCYQRGYRWTETQVTQLLEDLFAWGQTKPKPFDAENSGPKAPAYCLQPLVVVPRNAPVDGTETFDVVDGQQRLTTLFLILQNLRPSVSDGTLPTFSVTYERHPCGLADLLRKIEPENATGGENDTPDLHFIRQAHATIAEWMGLEKEDDPERSSTLANLLRVRPSNDLSPCVQFIWYRLPDNSDGTSAIQAFERLNSGKIALTDSELIRGLFFKRSPAISDDTHRHIALRWDQMERRLRDDEFWAFLGGDLAAKAHPEEIGVCRIGWLFALHAGLVGQTHDHALFHYYEPLLTKAPAAHDALWEKIEDLFSTLEHWFDDTTLFHLIGVSIHLGENIPNLRQKQSDPETNTKSKFKTWIKIRLRELGLPNWDPATPLCSYLQTIQHPENRARARSVLLCFNMATLEADPEHTTRLSFHRLRHDEWDIEHIRATNQRLPENEGELLNTLNIIRAHARAVLSSTPDHPVFSKIKPDLVLDGERGETTSPFSSFSAPQLKERLERLVEALDSLDGGPRNDLANLALLDAETNRGYGAAPFLVKRWWILSVARKTRYILPCTLAVFTKAYSEAPLDLLHWTKSDAEAYFETMAATLGKFFDPNWEKPKSEKQPASTGTDAENP